MLERGQRTSLPFLVTILKVACWKSWIFSKHKLKNHLFYITSVVSCWLLSSKYDFHKHETTGILTHKDLNFTCEKIDDLLHTHIHHGPCHNVLFCCNEGSNMYVSKRRIFCTFKCHLKYLRAFVYLRIWRKSCTFYGCDEL